MRPSCHKPGGSWGHHVTNLEVDEAGSNEKSITVNLAIRDLAASPLYHFTFINLGTCVNKISWLRKPLLKTLWRLTHTSPGFIEPRISTVQLVNWTRPMLPKHLRLQWQQKQTTEMCPFYQGIWTQMARPCQEAGFEISKQCYTGRVCQCKHLVCFGPHPHAVQLYKYKPLFHICPRLKNIC